MTMHRRPFSAWKHTGCSACVALGVLIGLSNHVVVFAQKDAAVPVQGAAVARGKQLFETRCVACHSLDTHRVGPALGTVWGRRAGKAADYVYSPSLAAAKHVWTTSQLLAWLTNPEDVVPGQAMGYQLESAQDRGDAVAYLASLATKTTTTTK